MIHKVKIIFAAILLIFCFSSCFEITEEFTINDDGSGQYSMKMDMYKMIEMISSFGGKDSLKENKDFGEIKDTTILFADNIDESKELSKEEKDLFRQGNMNMKMQLKEKEFYFKFNFPYKKEGDLQKIYDLTPKAMKEINLDSLNNKDEGEEKLPKPPGADVATANQYFELITGKGFFEKKVKKEELKKYLESDSTLNQMLPMLGNVYISSVIHLPRPAKNVSHPYAKLSDDRKTVTLKFPFSDYMERPEVLNFRVEY